MPEILSESLIILALILLNGFFAATEIAIISLRKSKTKELMNKGIASAKIINELQEKPEKFLATIQVGITVVTTLASAYGGARLIDDIAPAIAKIPNFFFQEYSELLAFTSVVVLISYFSLILGELVPKSLALSFTEKIARFSSYPIRTFARLTSFLVKILTVSTKVVMAPFKPFIKEAEAHHSEEEIRYLLAKSSEEGQIETREHEMIENVFEFGDLYVEQVMVPQNRITAVDISSSHDEIIEKIVASGYTRVPVYEGHLDNTVGIIYVKDFFAKMAHHQRIKIKEIMRPAIFVPSKQNLHDILQRFKKEKMHMAMVVDEYGGVVGLVTLEDILEEIVGDIADETDQVEKEIVERPDGTFMVDGTALITDINERIGLELPEDTDANSISGFLLGILKRWPKRGEKVEYGNAKFIIKKKTKKRITKVRVIKTRK